MKVAAIKSGRAFNGAHRDAGIIVHLVEELPKHYCSGSFWGDKALCGVQPGIRGNGWTTSNREVNCPKCLKKSKTN